MEKKQEKSQAELYREERKKRMAKVAQKNSKKSPQLSRFGKGLGKCFGILIIAACCLAVIYFCLSFFGVPQRALTAMKVGDKKVSVAKYNYYYMSVYTQLLSQTMQYEQQGQGYGLMYTGFDYKKLPEKQTYNGTIDGIDNPTWADYIDNSARTSIQQYDLYADLARENNLSLSEKDQKDIDDTINSLADSAKENDYSLSRFIIINYGKGVTEKIIREAMENQKLAQSYYEFKEADIIKNVSEEKVNEEFNKNIQNYTNVDIAYFVVAAEPEELAEDATEEQTKAANEKAMAEAKTKADAYLARVTDDNSVVSLGIECNPQLSSSTIVYKEATSSTLSNISDKALEWAFAAERVAGDKAVVEANNGYAVMYLIKTASKDTTKLVDVRHILFQFETDSTTGTASEEQKAAAKAKADAIYAKYKENATEENFIKLANENSEDPGSNTNGGLYENVYPGQMVTEFNDWIYDPARKPGDTEIIETSYGYHIMYYVSNEGNPEYWYYQCQSAIADAEYENYNKSVLNNNPIEPNTTLIKWAQDSLESIISNIIYRFTQSHSS